LWTGLLGQDPGGTRSAFNFELELENDGDGLYRGRSRISIIDDESFYGVFDVSAQAIDGTLVVTEQGIVENFPEPGTFWCTKTLEITVQEDRVGGPWTARNCADGTVYLTRSGPPKRWFEELPDCPCVFDPAIEGEVRDDKLGRSGRWDTFASGLELHPGAVTSIRWAASDGGSGQQCTYDEDRLLITDGLAAGTPDFVGVDVSPLTLDTAYYHWMQDVLSFGSDTMFGNSLVDLIVGEEDFGVFTCRQYYDLYPPNHGAGCPVNVESPLGSDAATVSCPALIEQLDP